jgi:hypothetical protein
VAKALIEKGSIDPDIEPALIIDTWKEQERQHDPVVPSTTELVLVNRPPQHANPFFWPDFNITSVEGCDWCLPTVDERLRLPNSVPF